MTLENIIWNKDTYQEFINYLYSLEDIKYKNFHSNLILDNNLIGIRTPLLKDIAKKISKSDYNEFIKLNRHTTYEETIIYGLIIGNLNADFNTIKLYLNAFIPYINNWAINDIVCANLKIFKKYPDEGFIFINECLNSNNCWSIRFGLVLLINYYINDDYINKVLGISNSINNDNYYVKMANAWLISICYIKYPKITHRFLLNNNLDTFTFNKAISKICDSRRIDNQTKNILKALRK